MQRCLTPDYRHLISSICPSLLQNFYAASFWQLSYKTSGPGRGEFMGSVAFRYVLISKRGGGGSISILFHLYYIFYIDEAVTEEAFEIAINCASTYKLLE